VNRTVAAAAAVADGVAMDLVIQAPRLSPAAAAAFRNAFPHEACERRSGAMRLHAVDIAAAPAADEMAHRWRCDAALVPAGLRFSAFRVLALDMDSTLIRDECIDEIARRAGRGAEVAAITAAAMRGEVADYAESLRRRVALLAGADAGIVQWARRHRLRLTPGAGRLIKVARHAGLHILLATGGFGIMARRLQERLLIDTVAANELGMSRGRLTGTVSGPAGDPASIVDAQGKARALQQVCARLGCTTREAIAIGDGANDLPMLQLAGLSVAFHAKPRVRSLAMQRLDHCGLDGVLTWFGS
jgi:phosphoserine phosphatase